MAVAKGRARDWLLVPSTTTTTITSRDYIVRRETETETERGRDSLGIQQLHQQSSSSTCDTQDVTFCIRIRHSAFRCLSAGSVTYSPDYLDQVILKGVGSITATRYLLQQICPPPSVEFASPSQDIHSFIHSHTTNTTRQSLLPLLYPDTFLSKYKKY